MYYNLLCYFSAIMCCVLLKDDKIHQLFWTEDDCKTYMILNPSPGYRWFICDIFYYDPTKGDFSFGFK